MAIKRNRQDPRRKVQPYLTQSVADEMEAAAEAAGLSLGQFIDRIWMERTRPQVKITAAEVRDVVHSHRPATPTMVPHRKHYNGITNICLDCGAVQTNRTAWAMSCPGPKEIP